MMKIIQKNSVLPRAVARILLVGSAGILLLATGCATTKAPVQRASVDRATSSMLRKSWGIEVASLHMSAGGHIVDFRYRVLDPKKAALLGDRDIKPTLTDLASGAILHVPSYPKTGSLRQTGKELKKGRTYFMLFANNGMLVKKGSRVTVTVGAFKVENLIVE